MVTGLTDSQGVAMRWGLRAYEVERRPTVGSTSFLLGGPGLGEVNDVEPTENTVDDRPQERFVG